MKQNKGFKAVWISFLALSIIMVLLFSTLIGLIFYFENAKTNNFWIEPPKVGKKTSKNENNYIHSFLASPLEQYSIYSSHHEVGQANGIDWATFNGNLNNYENIVNDDYEISLWNHDFDLFQFVIKAKTNLVSLQIEVENEVQLNQQGLSFEYGLNDYIYSKDSKYPKHGIWTPDKVTNQKQLTNVDNNRVYSFIFKVNYDKLTTPTNVLDSFKIKTIVVDQKTLSVYEQVNEVWLNFVDQDYQDLVEPNNQLNFLTNDQRLARYYLNQDLVQDPIFQTWTDADWNNEEKYVDYIWTHYLTKIYQKLALSTDMPYYTTFVGNITNRYATDHKTFTWDWDYNDPTLLTWHIRKDQDGKSEFYLPIDEQIAWKKNLEYALKAGFNKIFLRGFDGIKYEINPDPNAEQIRTNYQMKFVDDNLTTQNQTVFLSTSPFNNLYFEQYDIFAKDLTSQILKTMMDLIAQLDQSLTSKVTFYWYYDESDQRDFDANIKVLNELKNNNGDYRKFKTAYAIIYDALDLNDRLLINTDLIYLHHYGFDQLKESYFFQHFLEQRKAMNLKTSQYTMDTSKFQILGYEPGINAFWMNWTAYYDMPGLLHYAMNSWTKDSSWTSDYNDNSEVETGEITFIYPNNLDHSETFISYRLALYQYGYRLNLKQQVLKTVSYYDQFEQANWTRGKMSSSKFDFGKIESSNYSVNPTSKWILLNWIYQYQPKKFDVNVKLKSDYWLVNHTD